MPRHSWHGTVCCQRQHIDGGAQILQKYRSHLKIVGTKRWHEANAVLKATNINNNNNNNNNNNYLLTPWCRVLPEQVTGLQLVKKFPAFHGTRRFITALTSVRHLSISWASPIQSTCPHPTSWRSILILSTHLRLGLPSGLLPLVLYYHVDKFCIEEPV